MNISALRWRCLLNNLWRVHALPCNMDGTAPGLRSEAISKQNEVIATMKNNNAENEHSVVYKNLAAGDSTGNEEVLRLHVTSSCPSFPAFCQDLRLQLIPKTRSGRRVPNYSLVHAHTDTSHPRVVSYSYC